MARVIHAGRGRAMGLRMVRWFCPPAVEAGTVADGLRLTLLPGDIFPLPRGAWRGRVRGSARASRHDRRCPADRYSAHGRRRRPPRPGTVPGQLRCRRPGESHPWKLWSANPLTVGSGTRVFPTLHGSRLSQQHTRNRRPRHQCPARSGRPVRRQADGRPRRWAHGHQAPRESDCRRCEVRPRRHCDRPATSSYCPGHRAASRSGARTATAGRPWRAACQSVRTTVQATGIGVRLQAG